MQDSPLGQRFSLVYLKSDQAITDSDRLRRRIMKAFEKVVARSDHSRLGDFLEGELGIAVLRQGYNGQYIKWEDILHWQMRDVLCTVTLVFKYIRRRRDQDGRSFFTAVRRIFAEEHAAYTIDDEGGVHPFIDSGYQAQIAAVLRGLGAAGNSGALGFVQKADQELMPGGDPREAIRAIFDAAENIFKITFEGAIALNKDTIQKHLQPHLTKSVAEPAEQRASSKLCASLIDWADACHNYRHAPSAPDPAAPSEVLAVALVSQGLGYVRWLSDLQREAQAASTI